jgi:hypothetical protein
MVALSLINRLPEAVKAGGEADKAAMARQVYNGKIAEKYNFRYGKSSLSCPRMRRLTQGSSAILTQRIFKVTSETLCFCHSWTLQKLQG